MSTIHDWKVIREHQGDRFYREGEIRQGTDAELGHLVPRVLTKLGPSEEKAEAAHLDKSEPPHLNKARSAAPAHKAATGRKAKPKAKPAAAGEKS